jgi:pilus assembly protein Flp/PilA
MKAIKTIKDFLLEEDGLTTVEYAIAGGLVGVAVIVAFQLLGNEVNRVIMLIVTALQTATT